MSGAGVATISGEGTARRAWSCTEGSDLADTSENKSRCLPSALVRSWQRTALYVIILILMLLVFLNIALTLWIIVSLRLSMDNIGPIRILNGGIQVEGQTFITDRLVASSISSRPGQPITIHSHRNFSVLISQPDQTEYTKMLIKRDSLECGGRSFEVSDSRGKSIFKASREEVKVSAEALTVDGAGGVNVKTAVQTASVRSPPGSDLQLESQTRRLELRAPQQIHLESRAGSVDITSHTNIKMNSVVGAIRLEAQNIYISKLKEAVPTNHTSEPKPSREVKVRVYQVCACASGKLFLAPADGLCVANTADLEDCR